MKVFHDHIPETNLNHRKSCEDRTSREIYPKKTVCFSIICLSEVLPSFYFV